MNFLLVEDLKYCESDQNVTLKYKMSKWHGYTCCQQVATTFNLEKQTNKQTNKKPQYLQSVIKQSTIKRVLK